MPQKSDQADILKEVSNSQIDTEQNIPMGGTHIISYEKDKQEHIGVLLNKSTPVRVDSAGEHRPQAVNIQSEGSYTQFSTVPYTEEVNNQNFPCGTYETTIANKYGVNVGAGGIEIRTIGNSKFIASARSTIIGTEELNFSSDGNINMKSNANITIESTKTLTLRTPDQVVVDCNLGVSGNTIINGSTMIDGELYINHVTCPSEIQYTGGGIGSFGQMMPNLCVGYANASSIYRALDMLLETVFDTNMRELGYSYSDIPVNSFPSQKGVFKSMSIARASSGVPQSATNIVSGTTQKSKSPEYSIFVYSHEHPFYNIPFTNKVSNQTMRNDASVLNSGELGKASPIKNGFKIPTS
jgi:hypothetical protein